MEVATEPLRRRRVPAIIPETLAKPRYFFHVQVGQDIPDDTGTVCADPQDARAQAVIAAGALLRDLGARFWHDADWRMHVTDQQGGTACDLRFRGTMSAAA